MELDYAFPHSAEDEARRLELLQERLDPITHRRVERLGIGPDADVLGDRRRATHPRSWHETFPNGSLSRGRLLLRQFPTLGLVDVGADGEVDVIQAGTPLAEL